MSKAANSGKRIVSKGEYAKVQGTRTGLRVAAVLLHLVALFFGLNALSCFLLMAYSLSRRHFAAVEITIYIVLFMVMGIGAHYFRKLGRASLRRVAVLGDIVPLTRANTADLPAPDSLVRASQEPEQAQEAVLLRASVKTQDRHEEQLLRASAGEQA